LMGMGVYGGKDFWKRYWYFNKLQPIIDLLRCAVDLDSNQPHLTVLANTVPYTVFDVVWQGKGLMTTYWLQGASPALRRQDHDNSIKVNFEVAAVETPYPW